jgi:hypothetical protein
VNKHSRFLLIILATLILSGCGITAGSLRGDPGYADLDYPGWREVDKEFGLSLGRLPLRFAAWAIDEDDDPETAALLRGLKGMRIRIYEVQGDEQRVFDRIDESRRRLERDGWDKLVTVNDGDENVLVMIKTNNTKISGMTVLTADRDEAVFVNMIGDIQPEFFNEIMNSVDADVDVPDIEIVESPHSDDV